MPGSDTHNTPEKHMDGRHQTLSFTSPLPRLSNGPGEGLAALRLLPK
jgi:hypothetical protein